MQGQTMDCGWCMRKHVTVRLLLRDGLDDVRVALVRDAHGAHAEQLTCR